MELIGPQRGVGMASKTLKGWGICLRMARELGWLAGRLVRSTVLMEKSAELGRGLVLIMHDEATRHTVVPVCFQSPNNPVDTKQRRLLHVAFDVGHSEGL